jgi:hypothetical protein
VPVLPAGVTFVDIAAGAEHSVARSSDGELIAWGRNNAHQCEVPAPPAGSVCVEIEVGGEQNIARYAAPAPEPALSCEPGNAGVIPCPCANPPSGSGRGCDNSAATGGATIAASGSSFVSADTLAFTATGERPSAFSLLLRGPS